MTAREHEYWVYSMASLSGTLYTGITGALFTRVMQHKAGEIEGFTRQYKCNRLVYYERFEDVRMAIAREKQIKRWRRCRFLRVAEPFKRSDGTYKIRFTFVFNRAKIWCDSLAICRE